MHSFCRIFSLKWPKKAADSIYCSNRLSSAQTDIMPLLTPSKDDSLPPSTPEHKHSAATVYTRAQAPHHLPHSPLKRPPPPLLFQNVQRPIRFPSPVCPFLNGCFLSPQAARHRSTNVLYKELAASIPFRAPATTRDTATSIHIKYRQICLFQLVDGGSYAFLFAFFIKIICVWCLPQMGSLEICTRCTSQAMLVASTVKISYEFQYEVSNHRPCAT
jgi:hypothetical protein